MITNSVAG